MPIRLTAYLPDRPAVVHWMRGECCRIGRAPDCELRLDHFSVSRHHAELRGEGDALALHDLDSKNGSFIDGIAAQGAPLPPHAWLRFGDVHCEYETFDATAQSRAAMRWNERRAASQVLSEGLARQTAFPDLLRDTVRAVVQLADCERGFLLLRDDAGWRVQASHGIEADALRGREFRGSVGAVERAMQSRQAVVLNDVGADPSISTRASVVAAGLQSLVALPLLHGNDVLALVYADTRRPKAAISQMDMELLEAFGERAALWIAAKRAAASLDRLAANAPAWHDIALAAQP